MIYNSAVATERIKNLSVIIIERGTARNIQRMQDYHNFIIGIVDMPEIFGEKTPEYIEAGQCLRYVQAVIFLK